MQVHLLRSPQPSPVCGLIKRPRPGRRRLRCGHTSGTRKHGNLANTRALPTSMRSLGPERQQPPIMHYGWPALEINTPTQCHDASSTTLRLAVGHAFTSDYVKRSRPETSPELLCPKPWLACDSSFPERSFHHLISDCDRLYSHRYFPPNLITFMVKIRNASSVNQKWHPRSSSNFWPTQVQPTHHTPRRQPPSMVKADQTLPIPPCLRTMVRRL